MTAAKRASIRKPTLRDAQKAQTRQRILDAARSVFFREGYYGATVDQIVAEAGASRPTFYLHFRDKEQILGELMENYVARALPYMERLPGPQPTVEQLETWLYDIGAFLEQEQAIASVLTEVSAHRQANRPRYGLAAIAAWVTALARRAPAFAAAVRKTSPDVAARARAQLLIIEIAWAGETISMNADRAFVDEAVRMVATSLHEFLSDPRFHVGATKAGKARSTRR
ncbi:TetR family transcriptional regulator [Steroidobacter flavus]|uniref:TetR family transcriptional regulator n=1 Tax=Steroidobacter flavus TaxID=1842136 RepID=A0ABV8SZN7_9GAMM